MVAFPSTTFRAVLASIMAETPDVRTFRFALPPGRSFSFEPGQHVRVRFPGETETRDYSIASSPSETDHLELTISRAGKFTERLFALKTGDTLEMEGPRGDWGFDPTAPAFVLVSGGTGIAPMRAIAHAVLDQARGAPLWFYFSCRTPADVIYRGLLAELERRGAKVRVTVTRPDEMKPGETWDGPRGRLTLESLVAETGGRVDAAYYLCGPTQLVEELRDGLLKRGVPAGRVRCEAWGAF